jgi:N-acetylated-alpha-linked acidic dipeptidase
LIGSTEWVEDHIAWLNQTVVAYLNIDVAVSGPHPSLSCTPELQTIGTDVMKKIIHPAGGFFNETMFDAWYADSGGWVEPLGSGSDYTAFLHKGMSSVSELLSNTKQV